MRNKELLVYPILLTLESLILIVEKVHPVIAFAVCFIAWMQFLASNSVAKSEYKRGVMNGKLTQAIKTSIREEKEVE